MIAILEHQKAGFVLFIGIAALIVAVHCSTATAQTSKMTVTLKTEEPLALPGLAPMIQHEKRKILLNFPNQRPIELPRNLAAVVSEDGHTILQFGDELVKLTNPPHTDLYWLDAQGKVVGKLVDYYAGNSVVSMSYDGYTAVAGKLFGKPEESRLGLYSPQGIRIWEVRLGTRERIDQILVAPGGQWTASLVTDSERWLQDHRIQLRQKQGELSATYSGVGIIQRLVLLDDGQILFIQGYDHYGMADLQTGKLIWQLEGKIRMASASGAALSPDRNTLFLILADVKDKHQSEYNWMLQALDAKTGDELIVEKLPRQYPSTWNRVFEEVSPSAIRIQAGSHRLTFDWKREGGVQ